MSFYNKKHIDWYICNIVYKEQKAMCGQVLVRENDMENHEL